jgi:hypothetical protein
MELRLNQWFVWFAVATGGGLVVYMATQTYRRSSYRPTGRLVVSKISHKLLFWSKVSWLQAIFLLIYIALNIFLMVLGFGTIEDWAIRLVSPYVDISADVIVSGVVERLLDGIALSELLLNEGGIFR